MPPTFDEISARAAAWLEPVPGPSPGGAPLRYDPSYELVRAEIGKLESASGAPVDWKALSVTAGDLLRTKSKDVLLAAVLGHALHATDGPAGLATGAALLAEMLDRYWDTMHPEPKRLPARTSAVLWYLEKTCAAIEASSRTWSIEEVESVEVATRKLEEVVRARLGDRAPAFGPLRELLERARKTAAPPGETPSTQPPTTPPEPVTPPEPAPRTSAVPAALGSADEATDFLRRVGDVLIEAASTLRQASSADPVAYRVLRTGLWLHLPGPPPAPGGRTAIQAPPEALRAKLAALAQHQRWPVLIEEVESALPRNRFALDLQRSAWQALDALGGHEPARDAVALEVRALLARMPPLMALEFADGTPLAAAPTRAWIDEVVARRGPGVSPPQEAGAADHASRIAEVRKTLANGNASEALARVQAAIMGAASGRERFLLRIELACACAGAGLNAVAKGVFEELVREVSAHGLDIWEPRLAAEALKGLITSSRALANDPRAAVPELADHYRRLCGIDPAAAHEVWP